VGIEKPCRAGPLWINTVGEMAHEVKVKVGWTEASSVGGGQEAVDLLRADVEPGSNVLFG